MSILVKPYTISVWDDVWENGQFVEKRLGIIGSDKMAAQCRVIEPSLTRNINGSKKLTFKMYHKYVDTITGEEVINPFSKWMISERKVKLYYEDKQYDFVIKNIVENSSTHLYTYQLEDAIVMELSKNGFNTILDAELQNNMGNAKTLAESILSETDWDVESEKFVERVEENLVYATITETELPDNAKIYRLLDKDESITTKYPAENNASLITKGVFEEEVTNFFDNSSTKTILAFYSSCKNKPYRFQFIYLNNYAQTAVKIDKNNRTIQEEDCQYFIEFWPDDYKDEDNEGFVMPKGVTVFAKTYSDPTLSNPEGTDGTISIWYKGNRYGYAQQAIYSPKLERYINLYKDSNNIDYYGYLDNQYMSPTIVKNLVSNTSFTSTSGWIGASTTGASSDKAIVENVYGRFDGDGTFISSMDDLKNGITNQYNDYNAYMRVTLPTDNSIVFNDGIYDNRKSIGNMEENSEWAFRIVCHEPSTPSVDFGEYNYSDGAYVKIDNPLFSIEQTNTMKGYSIYTVGNHYESVNTFVENSHIRIALSGQGTYYIKEIEFFSAHYKNEALITPDSQGETIDEGVIIPTYYYFSKADHDAATSLDDLKNIEKSETGPIESYLPVFNEGAEKVRAVSVKESNHFNNLQAIAETFDCQIDFEITRDAFGGIGSKKVILKNYAGNDNHACFRYGVNLKDIQRTYESKNITTKLIVKQNNNELGEDSFCTIQRAGANPTGESYIYDFQYYQNIGLMSADQYIDVLYKMNHNGVYADGPDIADTVVIENSGCNIQGYFPRLRSLNEKIINENKLLSGIVADLREKNTQLKIAQTTLSAATEGEAEVSEDFYKLTGLYPDEIDQAENKDQLLDNQSVQNYIIQYNTYKQEAQEQTSLVNTLSSQVNSLTTQYNTYYNNINKWTKQKARLNKEFYKKYSRFIQEGTWIGEEYVDDDKYYSDALSVIYNSCYPKVAYAINVVTLSSLPGYEDFVFNVGDKTYVVDPEFFGDELQEEVIITEMSNMLDDPSKDTIKVQNFKNQFQDLFQKITATSQQVQYNAGSYERGSALAQAISDNSIEFLTQTLDEMTVNLSDPDLESSSTDGSSSIKIVDGKILLGKKKEDGKHEWTIGLSSAGISANKITAGSIDTGVIQIMNGTDPAFRWDAFGISAFGNEEYEGVVSGIDTKKFVRFDKYGIYGINGKVDGLSWPASNENDIDNKATFSLTWQGLKVTGNDGVEARIGKYTTGSGTEAKTTLMKVTKGSEDTFRISDNGDVFIKGDLQVGDGSPLSQSGINLYVNSGDFSDGWTIRYPDALMSVSGTDSNGNTIKQTTRNFNSIYQPISVQAGETYTLSAIVTVNVDDCLVAYCEENENGDATNRPTQGKDIEISANTPTHVSVTFTTKNSGKMAFRFEKKGVDSIPETDVWLQISSIKLEKGSVASKWTPSPRDGTVGANINTNKFSWKFSSNQGMFMWNGPQGAGTLDDENLVFGIANTSSTSTPKYTLRLKGMVEVESGKIGQWNVGTISKDMNWSSGDATAGATQYSYTDVFYSAQGWKDRNNKWIYSMLYFRPGATGTSHLIAARIKTGANDINGKGVVSTKFAVCGDGTIAAEGANIQGNIVADQGSIAGWTIDNNSLKSPKYTFQGSTNQDYESILSPQSLYIGASYQNVSVSPSGLWYEATGTFDGSTSEASFGGDTFITNYYTSGIPYKGTRYPCKQTEIKGGFISFYCARQGGVSTSNGVFLRLEPKRGVDTNTGFKLTLGWNEDGSSTKKTRNLAIASSVNNWLGYKNGNGATEYLYFEEGICTKFSNTKPTSGKWVDGTDIS